ncbi:hypothetical protein ABZS71_06720 [Streptomyces sp. NPDC005393]|uniref:hypothetical protein n=1 Tax=Streptomyces sp. NPDC005393 TaxID=3157041 RepID=UPI0033BFA6C8
MPAREKLVILDPEAPKGFRRVSYGPVFNGKPLRSPAMRKFIQGLVRDQMAVVERERQEAAWVERQLATAPPLTAYQSKMLRRVKTDLTKAAQSRTKEPASRVA